MFWLHPKLNKTNVVIMAVFFTVFSLFVICPGDEKINMRLGTYGRNPHEPAILIHPRIS